MKNVEYLIIVDNVKEFKEYLKKIGRTENTISQYIRNMILFMKWLNNRSINEEILNEWKKYLKDTGNTASTVNTKLAAVNAFCRFMMWDIKVSFLKVQRRIFREPERELTRAEYERLIDAAKIGGRQRLMLLMETICSTGIRVSEVKYITVESINAGFAEVSLKGKIRTILISKKLCYKLKKYAKKQKIFNGEIFLTKSGKTLSRHQIWSEFKSLCKLAGVESSKVFPHNLRHLFAKVFYKVSRDIVKLADVMGHSSIETTRIYLVTSGTEHRRQLERMNLVS